MVQEKVNINEKIIKDIHSILLMDKPKYRGIYRKFAVMIMGADNVPPQPY